MYIGIIIAYFAIQSVREMAFEPDAYASMFEAIDLIFFGLYFVNLFLVLVATIAMRRGHIFSDPWNIYDALIIGLSAVLYFGPSLVDDLDEEQAARGLLTLRIFRIIPLIPPLHRLTCAFVLATPRLLTLFSLFCMMMAVYACVGVRLFAASYSFYFQNISMAVQTLLQVLTLDDWAALARSMSLNHQGAWLYLGSWVLFSFIFVGALIGIIAEAFHVTAESEQKTSVRAKIAQDTDEEEEEEEEEL